ncbi:unnamed protein product [Microthlaspi erraticum]|uniref:Uncharacterized protein n=1 Tax=Microthlaspi erraticum TaxID=1685480 RepID=A0A6D2L056_9BRAS|nr:unnamed protein product [Microthlaspi erraticum]
MRMICEKRSLSSIELRIELSRAEDRVTSQECGFGGLDFSKSSTSGKGKPWKDAKVHGQDGEQDQKFGEESFWFFKQEEEVQGPTFPRSRSLLTTPRRLPAQEPHRASSFEPREGEDNTQRRRKSSKARRSNSIESKQRKLNSIELRVELTWRSPCLRTLDSSTINAVPGLLSDPGPLQPLRASQLHQGQGSHTL